MTLCSFVIRTSAGVVIGADSLMRGSVSFYEVEVVWELVDSAHKRVQVRGCTYGVVIHRYEEEA